MRDGGLVLATQNLGEKLVVTAEGVLDRAELESVRGLLLGLLHALAELGVGLDFTVELTRRDAHQGLSREEVARVDVRLE